jgi:HAE1 family hydrophobic/amphiphilic exporter-1/multidrug efflux pump
MPFVELSIRDVVVTLFVAIGLVFMIMYLFLQNLRATLIPTIAGPTRVAARVGPFLAERHHHTDSR